MSDSGRVCSLNFFIIKHDRKSDTDNAHEPSDTPQEEQVIPQAEQKTSTESC